MKKHRENVKNTGKRQGILSFSERGNPGNVVIVFMIVVKRVLLVGSLSLSLCGQWHWNKYNNWGWKTQGKGKVENTILVVTLKGTVLNFDDDFGGLRRTLSCQREFFKMQVIFQYLIVSDRFTSCFTLKFLLKILMVHFVNK